jgi:hypothetical protein
LVGGDHGLTGLKATYSTFEGTIPNLDEKIVMEDPRWTSLALINGVIFTFGRIQFLAELNWYLFRHGKPLFIPALGITNTL